MEKNSPGEFAALAACFGNNNSDNIQIKGHLFGLFWLVET